MRDAIPGQKKTHRKANTPSAISWKILSRFQKSLLILQTVIIIALMAQPRPPDRLLYARKPGGGRRISGGIHHYIVGLPISQGIDYFSTGISDLNLHSDRAVQFVSCAGQARVVSPDGHLDLV